MANGFVANGFIIVHRTATVDALSHPWKDPKDPKDPLVERKPLLG
jgi:hypothetical protein